ncbi:uncharacterized protein LOC125021789 [Mugil cephalus]|uniref:uncharacterized protein LOC125021789 n=1 Tax=Mugil cephalus TaxID=48193 RepID=UPI001FB60C56|nr:uncharacterized protein LOC125021789 [Mugil cephalus]
MAGGRSWSYVGTNLFIAGCTIVFVSAFPVAQIIVGAVYIYECPAAPFIPVYVMVSGICALLLMGLLALPKLLSPAVSNHIIWTVSMLSLVLFVFIWFFYGSYQIYSIHPPNYKKNLTASVNSSTIFDGKMNSTLGNQSHPNLNQTWMRDNNQTLRIQNETFTRSNVSSETNRSPPNTPKAHNVLSLVPYCARAVYLFAFWTTTLVYVFAGNTLLILACIYGFMAFTSKCVAYLTP